MLWQPGPDSINRLFELTEQKRVEDPWYNDVLVQCRQGALNDENYCFLLGLPTQHVGSWRQPQDAEGSKGYAGCGNDDCNNLHQTWREMATLGQPWKDMCKLECSLCRDERVRRNRLVEPQDDRIKHVPFLHAPYIHQNNEPKYHALLIRAVENAKRAPGGSQHVLWCCAQDTPHNPGEIAVGQDRLEKKRSRWLQFHDQRTASIPGLLPLYFNMHARVTEQHQQDVKHV